MTPTVDGIMSEAENTDRNKALDCANGFTGGSTRTCAAALQLNDDNVSNKLMAGAEMLSGHKNAVTVRLKYIEDEQNRSTGKA